MYRLLIVDDEPGILEGLKSTLDWAGLGFGRVATAQSCEEAIARAIEIRPHVALLDVCLEGGRFGYDIIRALGKLSLPTRYIMVSGYDEFRYVKEALETGAKGYLLKPVDRGELEGLVRRVILEDLKGTLPKTGHSPSDVDPVTQIPYAQLSKLANKMIVMIKMDYGKNISLKRVAEHFKMSGVYLGRTFLSETKIKFSEYLMVYRMQRAKELIQTTHEKISNIARQVGYTNVNYFYIHFKGYYNASPSAFRGDGREEINA